MKFLDLFAVCVALTVTAGLEGAMSAPHKGHHTQPLVLPRDAAPDTTATIPSKTAPAPAAPIIGAEKDDEPLPAPYHLPAASRARMRDCGEKWQEMKMAGDAGEEIWRTFATQCLAAENGPFDTRSP